MLRHIADMPAGTLGFEAVGEVEDDDWRAAVEPVLRRELPAGRKVRLLYLVGPGAADLSDDVTTASAGFRARHADSFERVALVSDAPWMGPALRVWSALLPGKARGFRVGELEDAKAWVAEGVETGPGVGST